MPQIFLMKKILLLSALLSACAYGAMAQESLEVGRRPRREHFHVDTLDEVPTSNEHMKRYEVELAAGLNYAGLPEHALAPGQVRGDASNTGSSFAVRAAYYFSHSLCAGVSFGEDNLGYSYGQYNVYFAAPAQTFGVFSKYYIGYFYVGASLGYTHIAHYANGYNTPFIVGSGETAPGPANGFTADLQLGCKVPVYRSLSVFGEAGIYGISSDPCKDVFYSGLLGISVKFKEHLVYQAR